MGKFVGLLVVAIAAHLAFLAWWIPTKSVRVFLAATAAILWFVSCFAFVGLLAYEAIESSGSSMHCPVGNDNSEFVPAHWSWAPPGVVCEYPSGDVGPTYWRIPAALVLAVIPPLAVAAWPRRRSLVTS